MLFSSVFYFYQVTTHHATKHLKYKTTQTDVMETGIVFNNQMQSFNIRSFAYGNGANRLLTFSILQFEIKGQNARFVKQTMNISSKL